MKNRVLYVHVNTLESFHCYFLKVVRLRGYKTFPCATQLHLSMDFITLINVKIPRIVGIIASISMHDKDNIGGFERKNNLYSSAI